MRVVMLRLLMGFLYAVEFCWLVPLVCAEWGAKKLRSWSDWAEVEWLLARTRYAIERKRALQPRARGSSK